MIISLSLWNKIGQKETFEGTESPKIILKKATRDKRTSNSSRAQAQWKGRREVEKKQARMQEIITK